MSQFCFPSRALRSRAAFGPHATPIPAFVRSFRHLVTEKHLQRALALVEKGQVVQFVAQPSGRRMYQVPPPSGSPPASLPHSLRTSVRSRCAAPPASSCQPLCLAPSFPSPQQVEGTSGAHYLSFPGHFCSCKAFLFDVLGRGDQIYVRLPPSHAAASALGRRRIPLLLRLNSLASPRVGPSSQCKHQLACLLACALRMERVHPVSDVAMAHLAEHAGEVGPLL